MSGSSELEADSRPGLTLVLRLPWRLPASSEENSPDSGLASLKLLALTGITGHASASTIINPAESRVRALQG